MIRIFVDSGSSIKPEDKEKCNVEIIPLRYMLGETEYEDGIGLGINEFYKTLIETKTFPKTSLPFLEPITEKVTQCTDAGDDVFIITISSKISGTYNAIRNLFVDNKKVWVIDSLSAVGGVQILVKEINKYQSESPEFVLEKVNALIPRIQVLAIPETLEYLFRGGRLSRKDWLIGSILSVKPLITIANGAVGVHSKKFGLKNAMRALSNILNTTADTNYPIVPSYTYNSKNLEELIKQTSPECQKVMTEYDNLCPTLGCHWGPNAFGFIFIKKEEN